MGGRGGPARQAPQSNSAGRPVAAPSLDAQIPAIISQLRSEKPNPENPWVRVADLRERLGGTRAEQDAALKRLSNDRTVMPLGEEIQGRLTQRDRDAAFMYGGQTNELIRVGG